MVIMHNKSQRDLQFHNSRRILHNYKQEMRARAPQTWCWEVKRTRSFKKNATINMRESLVFEGAYASSYIDEETDILQPPTAHW